MSWSELVLNGELFVGDGFMEDMHQHAFFLEYREVVVFFCPCILAAVDSLLMNIVHVL